tara:strand:- start:45 stop:281 length:237 start_codon:yes stop_codon:yes gene_type:complete
MLHERENNKMNLSDQAIGAVMMALQKSILEQSDIVPVLKGFDFVSAAEEEGGEAELFVKNPPLVKMGTEETEETGLEE